MTRKASSWQLAVGPLAIAIALGGCGATEETGEGGSGGSGVILTAPQNLVASRGEFADRVVLRWDRVAGWGSYHIYRAGSEGGDYTLIGSAEQGELFADSSNVQIDVHYYYRVAAASRTGVEGPRSAAAEGWAAVVRPPNPSFPDFELHLSEGTFWDFEWQKKESSYGTGTSRSGGRFRVVLGAPITIDGQRAFPVEVHGNANRYGPRWTHLAYADHVLFGSEDGASLIPIVDAHMGYWAGGGFFATLPQTIVFKMSAGFASTDLLSESTYVVGRSTDSNDIVCVPGLGCVNGGGADEIYNQQEFYSPDVGPVGYHQLYSYSDSSYQKTITRDVGLIATSLRGDAGIFITEQEPNQYPSSTQVVADLDKIVIGTIGTNDPSTTVGNLTTSYFFHDFYRFTTDETVAFEVTWDADENPGACISLCWFEDTGTSKVGAIHCSNCSADVGHTWSWMFSSQVTLPATFVVGLQASNGPSAGLSYSLAINK